MIAVCLLMKLSSVQLPMAISPPGRQTRTNSETIISGRGANIAPNIDITTSNSPSLNGNASASPSLKEI